ncbi:MAG: SLC13 family permease [Candidatus Thorarchaeota archaeon]
MGLSSILVLAIFIIVLLLIMSERTDETAITIFGMSLAGVVLFVVDGISFSEYLVAIEWGSILFIAAMLIIVAVAASSGMFQYLALILVRRTEGNPRKVFLYMMGFVFAISLFLDPLPTMLVIGTFTVEICRAIDMDFRPLLISEVIIANFASFPTIVGSVPNLVIALWTGVNASLMFIILMPLSIILFILTIPILLRQFKDSLAENESHESDFIFLLPPRVMINSKRDFYLSVIAMAILLTGFMLAPTFEIDVTMIALLIASGMLIFSEKRAKEFIRQLSWDTIFFLIGLFGLVVALNMTGTVSDLANGLGAVTGGNIFIAIILMIWIPGFALSIVDNIPVAAVLAPLAVQFGGMNPVVPMALLAGTNVGGYAIPFGDAPNMIAVSLAEKGHRPITFIQFTKVVLPIAIFHLIIITVYCSLVALFFI